MENLEEGLVNFGLRLEAILDFVDVVDGVVELDRLLADGWQLTRSSRRNTLGGQRRSRLRRRQSCY